VKSETLLLKAALAAFAVATSYPLAAQNVQDQESVKHHHYQFLDMGTFGGPVSSINLPAWVGTLNNQGVATGWSSTSTPWSPTSNPLVCGGSDGFVPFISHTFAWENGEVADLGSLSGPDFCSEPFWVNSKNEIVGASENGLVDPQFFGLNQMHPALWKDGRITDLGTLGGNQGFAFGANNRGQIVGWSTTAIPDQYCLFNVLQWHAFLWQHGQMQDLGTLGGNCAYTSPISAAAQSINDRGQVVGGSTTSTIPNPLTGVPTMDPFLWEEGKGMTDLGTLGGAYGGAQEINNNGQIVGMSSIASDPGACMSVDPFDPNCHTFLWDRGTLTDLTTQTIGASFTFARMISDSGDIVGEGAFPDEPVEALLWRNGVATDLGNLGGCFSGAFAINSRGQIVGYSTSCDGNTIRAFLWEKGSMVDLNLLIPAGSSLFLEWGAYLNERGEIVGNGINANGDLHGFLLIPCDEGHPGISGCDYSMVEVPPNAVAPTTSRAPAIPSPRGLLPRGPLAGFGAAQGIRAAVSANSKLGAQRVDDQRAPAQLDPK
jgi:probable HAF family extracellular repeat protein